MNVTALLSQPLVQVILKLDGSPDGTIELSDSSRVRKAFLGTGLIMVTVNSYSALVAPMESLSPTTWAEPVVIYPGVVVYNDWTLSIVSTPCVMVPVESAGCFAMSAIKPLTALVCGGMVTGVIVIVITSAALRELLLSKYMLR